MNYTSQREYGENIQVIGDVYANIPFKLMYLVRDKATNNIYFCYHLIDNDNSVVEYVVPTTIEEITRIVNKQLPIARFLRIALTEERLYKHIFRLDKNNNYEIMKESTIFEPILPSESIKFDRFGLFEELTEETESVSS